MFSYPIHQPTNFCQQYKLYPVRRAVDYSYALTYGNGRINGDFNSYPPPSRGVVSDMWRMPSINDRRDVSYDYAYKEHEYKQGSGEFPVFSLKDGIGNLGGEMQMNEVMGTYGHGHEKEYNTSRTYGRTSMGYTGLITGATNDVGTAVVLLMDAASGGGAKLGSRIGEVESPVNYYPAIHTTMDGSKRYGSFSLAPRRSSMGEPAKYYLPKFDECK